MPVTVRDDARLLHRCFFIVQEVIEMARFIRPEIQQADVAVTPSRAETCVPGLLMETFRDGRTGASIIAVLRNNPFRKQQCRKEHPGLIFGEGSLRCAPNLFV